MTYNRGVVDNLVSIKIDETLLKFLKKKSIILDIVFNT